MNQIKEISNFKLCATLNTQHKEASKQEIIIYTFLYLFSLADICQNYKTLTDAERRYDHVTVNFKCDRTLNGWYRFQGAAGETMVTKCPPLGRCGAQFPAWLSEGHPPAAEGTVTRNVCIHGDKGCCDKSVLIQVRNCRSYYIYKLTPPVMCDTRYCSIE